MASCENNTETPFAPSGGPIAAGPDWTNQVLPISSYYDSITGKYITSSNVAAVIPIMIAEPLRSTSTFISSSQDRLTTTLNNITLTTPSGGRLQLLGTLSGILSGITGVPSSISGSNTSQPTFSSTLTALTSSQTFSTINSTFFIDAAPFSRVGLIFASSLNSIVRVTVTTDFDSSFARDIPIGNSGNNPFNIAAGSVASPTYSLQTLTDKWPLLRVKVAPQTTPTSGTFTSFAFLG